MTASLILGFLWVIAASVAGLLPSKRSHWPAAYVLIATGLPLLVYIVFQNGLWVGLLFLAAGLSILRWPVLRLVRWLRGLFG